MKIILFAILIILNLSLLDSARFKKEPKKAEEEELMSDKELDALLLNDPKYSSLAADLVKTKGTKTEATESPLSSSDSVPKSNSHYMSSSYKEHLNRMKNPKSKKEDIIDMDLLTKSLSNDPLKDLDMLGTTTGDIKADEKMKEKKIIEDKFKAFDFISKQQARYLIEILKQPVFYNMIPPEAQLIVKV